LIERSFKNAPGRHAEESLMQLTNGCLVDLRAAPQFAEIVSDRIWRAWHEPQGVSYETLAARVRENFGQGPLPSAFVAHEGARFAGTISLIPCDLEERPQLTPWIAALWVEPEFRMSGVASALLAHGFQQARAAGFANVYLCARPALEAFYTACGWRLIERAIGPKALDVFARTIDI
jgi:GNAT superfamily N-acetyltransferase